MAGKPISDAQLARIVETIRDAADRAPHSRKLQTFFGIEKKNPMTPLQKAAEVLVSCITRTLSNPDFTFKDDSQERTPLDNIARFLETDKALKKQKAPDYIAVVEAAEKVVQELQIENQFQKVSNALSPLDIMQILAPLHKYNNYFRSLTRHHQESCASLIKRINSLKGSDGVFEALERAQYECFKNAASSERAGFYSAINQAREKLREICGPAPAESLVQTALKKGSSN